MPQQNNREIIVPPQNFGKQQEIERKLSIQDNLSIYSGKQEGVVIENRLIKESVDYQNYNFVRDNDSLHIPDENSQSQNIYMQQIQQYDKKVKNNLLLDQTNEKTQFIVHTPNRQHVVVDQNKINQINSFNQSDKQGRFMSEKQQDSYNDSVSAEKFLNLIESPSQPVGIMNHQTSNLRTPDSTNLKPNPLKKTYNTQQHYSYPNPQPQQLPNSILYPNNEKQPIIETVPMNHFNKVRISQYSEHQLVYTDMPNDNLQVQQSDRSELRNTNYYDQKLERVHNRRNLMQKLYQNTNVNKEKSMYDSSYQRAFGKLYIEDEVFRLGVGNKFNNIT